MSVIERIAMRFADKSEIRRDTPPPRYRAVFAAVYIALAAALSAAPLFAQGLRYDPPTIDGYEFPFPSTFNSPLTSSSPSILRMDTKILSDTSFIDFEGRRLTFQRIDSAGNSVWTYHYGELNDFITDGRLYSFYENWYNSLSEKNKAEIAVPAPPKLEWELAVHYPPWAQRLLGNEPPRLKLEGRLEVTVAFDYTKRTVGEEETIDIVPFDVITNYEFAMRGSVGRLISVNISHSKQDGFDLGEDPLKNIKIEYKESKPGELEDEIIQEIVAGYTGFDMPGTNLTGYSDKHDGLFGIKVRAKIGPLMLTGIASAAHGEAMTRELGGANDPFSVSSIREDEFIRNRYFFLDTLYKTRYNRFYNTASPDRSAYSGAPRVTQFQAFVSINCNETSQSTVRRYKANVEGSEACFRMLEENTDYTIDVDRGWVRFEHNVRDDNIVAITMTTSDGSLDRGTRVALSAENDSRQDLWVLKPRGLEEFDPTTNNDPEMRDRFSLMWRNVYFMPEIEDGKLDLFYFDPAVGDTIKHTASTPSRLISNVLGITDEQGRARLENAEIFDAERQELVIPPWSASNPRGNEPFSNDALGDLRDTSVYTFGQRTTRMTMHYTPKFGILTNGSVRRDVYDNLGWNILPGTVTVRTKSGTLLIEDEDYALDYQMGILELLSARARSAESILITYQRESDFVLESKVFMGLRGEIALPFISENSFMAGSVLYQSAATSAGDIPLLGNEPFSKLLFGFNTSLDFNPEWMTKAANLLPLVKTDAESSAKINFEIAHSRMNPNTARENGAYLEDFDRTKDSYTLSMRHQNWHRSHYPFPYEGGIAGIEQHMLDTRRIPAWEQYWFTPSVYDDRHYRNRFTVWTRDPNNSRYSSQDSYIDILRLHVTPASREHPRNVQERFDNAYSAITTSFGRNGLNMENHRYVEIVVNAGRNPHGKLMIQVGTFSHDQVRNGGPPNGEFDLEDPTYQNKPDELSRYDHGLGWLRDTLPGGGNYYMIPDGSGGWDTLSRDRNTDLLVSPRSINDPVGDMFRRYDRDSLNNFRNANGTRRNSIFDTENIDGDGIPRITAQERYRSYTIDLSNVNSQAIDRTARTEGDWRYYRIPLKDLLADGSITVDSVGVPDWSKVRGLRLVWFDFDSRASTSEQQLHIAGIELVGNYWEPAPGSEDKIEPTAISNFEDIAYYNSVHNLIVKPRSGEQTPEESSLRLRYRNMDARDTALVRRNLSLNPQNISGYDSLTVMVYSHQVGGDDDLRFVMRFGSDDTTYYEYSAPINRAGVWNRYAFTLLALSDLKNRADHDNNVINADSVIPGGRLRVVAPPNRRPNFTAITYMAVGVIRGPGGPEEGEMWVNELIVTGPRRQNGFAARLDVATQWADLLTLGAGVNYSDGSFRTMTEPLHGEDRSELSANLNARLMLNKLMPEKWGVAIPVGGSVSGALSRPTVKPQSDIQLLNDDGSTDGLFDMANDAFNMFMGRDADGEDTRAERYQTFSTTRNAYTSFEKTSESDNPLINFTLDRVKADVGYSRTTNFTGRGPREGEADNLDRDYYRTDTTVTYTGNLRYDLSPRDPPEWTVWAPFENIKWMPGIFKEYEFNLLPSTISFDLAEIQHRTEVRNDEKLNVIDFRTRTFDMRHGLRLDYTPIDPLLSLSYALRWDRDLSDQDLRSNWDYMVDSAFTNIFGLNHSAGQKWNEYYVLYGERGRTQSASARLTPQFVKWMTHSAEYTADYSGQLVRRDADSVQYMNANVGTSLRFRNSLLVTDLFKKLAGDAKKGILHALNSGVAKINMRTVSLEYDVTTNLRSSNMSSTFLIDTAGMSHFDYFRYQLGLGRDPVDYFWGRQARNSLGDMLYREGMGVAHDLYRLDQSMGSWSARAATTFTIPDPFRINFTNVSVGWGREFHAQPDTAFIDTTVILPDIRVAANTAILEKVPLVKRHLDRLNWNASFNYKNTRKETKERTDTTITMELMPLVGLDGRARKWPSLTGNYRYGISRTVITSGGKGDSVITNGGRIDTISVVTMLSTERSNRQSHVFNVAYEFTGAGRLKEIKIGKKWTIPVQGKAKIGMTVGSEVTERVYTIKGEEEDRVTRDSDFNYSPYIDYRFTDNIKGQVRYLGTHKNQNGMKTDQQRFAVTVEVKF